MRENSTMEHGWDQERMADFSDGTHARKRCPAMPSLSLKPVSFSPERLSKAEHFAAEAYKHEASTDLYTPPGNLRLLPLFSPQQHEISPAYEIGTDFVPTDNRSIVGSAELDTDHVRLTRNALAALDKQSGLLYEFLGQGSSQASIAGSQSLASETEAESGLCEISNTIRADQEGERYENAHRSISPNITVLNNPANILLSVRDSNYDDQAIVIAQSHDVAHKAERTSIVYGVISSIDKSEKHRCHDCGVDLEPDHSFTPRTQAASVAVSVTPGTNHPSPFTLKPSSTSQPAHASTTNQIGVPANDPLTTNTNATSSLDTAAASQVPALSKETAHTPLTTRNMAQDGNTTDVPSELHPQHRLWTIKSKVEENEGILRTTSDGHLGGRVIEEETGSIIALNKPDDADQKHYAETNKLAPVKRINAPESKNGGRGDDDPRARKPIHRVLKNWMTGSNRPPPEEPLQIFQVGDNEPSKANFEEMIKTRRHQGGAEVRFIMQKIIKQFWGAEVAKRFGEDWVDRTDADDQQMQELEDFVLTLTVDNPMTKADDRDRKNAEALQFGGAQSEDYPKKEKSSWWW